MNSRFKFDASNMGSVVDQPVEVRGVTGGVFESIKSLADAGPTDLCWIKSGLADPVGALMGSAAGGVICDYPTFERLGQTFDAKTYFVVADPKAAYARVVRHIHQSMHATPQVAIHPSAVVDPEAKLGQNVRIGAYSIIGACTIGDGTVVYDHVKIYPGVSIGRDCVVREFVTIGGEGFGYTKEADGANTHIPHIGTVVVEDRVHLFPFANVDRGTLGATVVRQGAVLDHYVHVGHNTAVGTNSILAAGVVLSGGASVGADCFIGVNSVLRQKQRVGNRVVIGMNAAVVNDVPDGEVWAGNPAKFLKKLESDPSH
jgi:UDP-3-O-[3-hydroxymyristoyl] glucosamine N-acyltransferase